MALRALLIGALLLVTGCTTARNAVQFGISEADGDAYEDGLYHVSIASFNPPGEEYSYFIERVGLLYQIGFGVERPDGSDFTNILGEGGAPGDAMVSVAGDVYGFTVAPTFMPTDYMAVFAGASFWGVTSYNEFRDPDFSSSPTGEYYVENDESFEAGIVLGVTFFFAKESGLTATLQYDSAFDAPGISVGWSF